jgi:hypothetical protein
MSDMRVLASHLLLFLSSLVLSCHISASIAPGQEAARKTAPPRKKAVGIGKAKLAHKPVSVLGGRLTVRMPQGARIEARRFPIMEAAESAEHETRVVYDAGQERLVLMIHESFALAGDDFERDVREWVSKWKGKYKIDSLPLPVKGLKAVAVIPADSPDLNRSEDATFVEGIFVTSGDRTIQSLDVYVNTAAEKDLKGCKAVAHQIILSVAPGKKKLQFSAGERLLYAFSKDWAISVTVPNNTVATKQTGADFVVHRLIVLGRLGSDVGSILIYVGSHPHLEAGAKKAEGIMFGKKVEWASLPNGRGLQTLCELPITGDNHYNAHVIIQAPNETQLEALNLVAESMKLVKPTSSSPK